MKLLTLLLLCTTITYCTWSSYYFYGDWLSGLIGGSIGCIVAIFTGHLAASSTGNTKEKHNEYTTNDTTLR